MIESLRYFDSKIHSHKAVYFLLIRKVKSYQHLSLLNYTIYSSKNKTILVHVTKKKMQNENRVTL